MSECEMSENWSKHFARCASNPDLLYDATKIFYRRDLESQFKPNDIYFAVSGNYVKIGQTTEIKKRIQTLSVSCPEGIKLIGVIQYGDEKQTHRDLNHLRIKGEWFKYSPEISKYILENGGRLV